jgi:hypothetical protein
MQRLLDEANATAASLRRKIEERDFNGYETMDFSEESSSEWEEPTKSSKKFPMRMSLEYELSLSENSMSNINTQLKYVPLS